MEDGGGEEGAFWIGRKMCREDCLSFRSMRWNGIDRIVHFRSARDARKLL